MSGAIVGNEVFDALAFGGGVLEVRTDGIDVKAGAIAEEAATLGRFEDIVTGVVVDGSDLSLKEEIVLDGFDDVFWASEVVVHDEATELGLDSKYAVV